VCGVERVWESKWRRVGVNMYVEVKVNEGVWVWVWG